MQTDFTIIPGLVVDEEMYERARDALRVVAPELPPLTWEQFIDEDSWFLVPDPNSFGYKAEYVVERTEERTIKLNRWMGPDLRDGQQPKPHNHPWDEFEALILVGGYTEDRYLCRNKALFRFLNRIRRLVGLGDMAPSKETIEHREGATNHIPKQLFHEVTAVLPRTLTMMVCSRGVQGDWGYIDPKTGEFTHNSAVDDPTFNERARAINPRMQ